MIAQNQRLTAIVFAVAFLLCIPLIAMQFTNEVKWSLSDFVVAGILLLGTGLTCEFVLRVVKDRTRRIALVGVVLVILLLTWIELAVGVFGTPFAGN